MEILINREMTIKGWKTDYKISFDGQGLREDNVRASDSHIIHTVHIEQVSTD